MPQISSKELTRKNIEKISFAFEKMMETVGKDKNMRIFISSFYTKTERIMLAKRLVSMMLLVSGWSVLEISRVLSMSDATVYKLSGYLDRDKSFYKLMEKYSGRLRIKDSKKYDEGNMGEMLDSFVDVFLPINWKKTS